MMLRLTWLEMRTLGEAIAPVFVEADITSAAISMAERSSWEQVWYPLRPTPRRWLIIAYAFAGACFASTIAIFARDHVKFSLPTPSFFKSAALTLDIDYQ